MSLNVPSPRLPPSSPCIRVCVLDEARFCIGCNRHVEEITAWTRMSAEQQWAVWEHIERRRAARSFKSTQAAEIGLSAADE